MIIQNKFVSISIIVLMLMVVIPGISQAEKIISISSGYNFVLALNDDGTILAWGENNKGQLGVGSTSDYEQKPQLVPIQDVKEVSAGTHYSLALKNDGTVWAWGNNEQGTLGDGTTQDHYLPVQVAGLNDIVAISAGSNTNLALKKDGTVWAWGGWSFCYGKDLYAGANLLQPVQVEGVSNVKSLGERGLFVIKNDGTVLAWGVNVISMWSDGSIYYGQLGNKSSVIYISVPFPVDDMDDVQEITLGAVSGAYLKNDGSVWAWGNSHNGQLGDGTFTNDKSSTEVILPPVKVKISDVKQISLQGYHLMALKNDGTVWIWGKDIDGSLTTRPGIAEPVQVNGLNNIVSISTGVYYNIALKNDGSVWGWGLNYGSSPVKIIGSTPGQIISTPTAIPIATPMATMTAPPTTTPTVSNPEAIGTILPTTSTPVPDASVVPAPGFGFGTIGMLCCILFVAGMASVLKGNKKM